MYDNDKIKSAVASNISELRIQKGLTQLQLAEKLSYSDKAVSKWERGESVPDIYVLKQIADLFGVSVDYLISTEHAQSSCMRRDNDWLYRKVSMISLLGVLAFSSLLFVLIWIMYKPIWQVFVFMIPVEMVLMIVFNSLWGNNNKNFYWISGLVLGLVTSIYIALLTFGGVNVWQLFILIMPAELVLVSVFKRS